MATPSQSRSSGREEEDNHEWRQAIEKRQLAERKTAKSSPPGDGEVKGRKRCVTHSSLNIRTSSSSVLKRSSGKLKARARINISWVNRSCPRNIQRKGPMSHAHPCLELPLSSSMRARLGPQEPGRLRPPVATTRAPRPDPMIAPMV
ncbi:hypothetical protein CK203_107513 [Vitis vinifera]|uniref:Uncharacterized protein n=1 Tax=Vitis vinifera TaxID=29760 RepID=A0A438CSJ4_VITVI|nr:hypothetical protein CK203_107513 [Vitis vinifera]